MILKGCKTSIRIPVKPSPPEGYILAGRITDSTDSKDVGKIAFTDLDYRDSHLHKIPYEIGDVIFVKETWKHYEKAIGNGENFSVKKFLAYKADEQNNKMRKPSEWFEGNWKSAAVMVKDSSRLFLKITDVRVEKLKEISFEDLKNEGVINELDDYFKSIVNTPANNAYYFGLYKKTFSISWDAKHKGLKNDPYTWDNNPWVYVFNFELCEDDFNNEPENIKVDEVKSSPIDDSEVNLIAFDAFKKTVTMSLAEFKKQEKLADLGRAVILGFKQPSSTFFMEPVKDNVKTIT